MKPTRTTRTLLAAATIGCGILSARVAPAQAPWWLDTLGYSRQQLSPIRVGSDGFPYVQVQIDSVGLWLLFDTGNMVGLTVDTRHYEQLRLLQAGSVRLRDSSGELVGEFRTGLADRVEALGQTATDVAVHEFRHSRLAGLFGPLDLPGSRFTLDYQAKVIAVASSPLPATTAGLDARRLIRSQRHPRLILVEGEVRGRTILIELDTGKSRTVVDPAWAAAIGLAVDGRDTVVIGNIQVGEALFHVTNAKPVSLGAIDPDLPAALVLSIGSDMLARLIVTVDYATGSVLLWEVER